MESDEVSSNLKPKILHMSHKQFLQLYVMLGTIHLRQNNSISIFVSYMHHLLYSNNYEHSTPCNNKTNKPSNKNKLTQHNNKQKKGKYTSGENVQ